MSTCSGRHRFQGWGWDVHLSYLDKLCPSASTKFHSIKRNREVPLAPPLCSYHPIPLLFLTVTRTLVSTICPQLMCEWPCCKPYVPLSRLSLGPSLMLHTTIFCLSLCTPSSPGDHLPVRSFLSHPVLSSWLTPRVFFFFYLICVFMYLSCVMIFNPPLSLRLKHPGVCSTSQCCVSSIPQFYHSKIRIFYFTIDSIINSFFFIQEWATTLPLQEKKI